MTCLNWQRFIQQRGRFNALFPVISLILVTLACNVLGQPDDRPIVIRTHLPTLTATRMPTLTPTGMPTPVAVATESEAIVSVSPVATPIVEVATEPTASNTRDISSSEAPGAMAVSVSASDASSDPTNTSVSNGAEVQVTPKAENNVVSPSAINTPAATATPLPTETALPTDVPTATPAATPPASEWIFTPAQVYTDQYEDGLLLYGEVINNTGVAQELGYIFRTFYDAQGQIIADENSTGDYWPFKLIPPGERLPFGLFVDGIYGAANFDLQVQAEPSPCGLPGKYRDWDSVPDAIRQDRDPLHRAGQYI